MSAAIDGLRYCFQKNREYAAKLVADLSATQMVAQPADDLPILFNHPAWVFSHLNLYLPIIRALIKGESFEDPKDHPFGMQSQPVLDPEIYPTKEVLMATFDEEHQAIDALLQGCDDAMLAQPVSLPRWQPMMPLVGIALPYLMLNHENAHLGQLSAWRRAMKLPRV